MLRPGSAAAAEVLLRTEVVDLVVLEAKIDAAAGQHVLCPGSVMALDRRANAAVQELVRP